MKQGTQEWRLARVGHVTASRIADLMARTKAGWRAGRRNYMAQLVVERLTGLPTESYINGAMQWGIDTEDRARNAYSFFTGQEVRQVGFILHPCIPKTGASSDGFVGFVGHDGLIEIKCPNTATHIETLLSQEIADEYIKQMQFQMACTGRQWCDFVSFDPRMKVELQLFIKRVERDNTLIGQIEAEVRDFLAELDQKIAALEELSHGL